MVETNTTTYDNLVFKKETAMPVTIVGEEIEVGQVLGMITASAKFVGCQSDGTDDGRRTAICVALEACDAQLADVEIPALFAGEVNEDELEFLGTDVLATHIRQLWMQGIYPKNPLDA